MQTRDFELATEQLGVVGLRRPGVKFKFHLKYICVATLSLSFITWKTGHNQCECVS